jgi:signal transduction histidine kinase
LATVGQLAAGMAHELRNPLTPVKMLVQGAIERCDDRGLAGRDLQIVSDEVQRLENAIQSFLDFARPPALEPALNCVCNVIRNACELVAVQAQRSGVEIRTALPAAGAQLFVDGVLLRQVFLNLLLNAIEELPDGGWVEVRADRFRRTENSSSEYSEHDALRSGHTNSQLPPNYRDG